MLTVIQIHSFYIHRIDDLKKWQKPQLVIKSCGLLQLYVCLNNFTIHTLSNLYQIKLLKFECTLTILFSDEGPSSKICRKSMHFCARILIYLMLLLYNINIQKSTNSPKHSKSKEWSTKCLSFKVIQKKRERNSYFKIWGYLLPTSSPAHC